MHHLHIFAKPLLGVACLVLFLGTGGAFAQTTTFTYEGQLTEADGNPASGKYPMKFKLFDAVRDGNQIGPTLTFDGPDSNPVRVKEGTFTVQLDFGANAFPGADRYLEVRVMYHGETTFKRLSLRQITSTPYAIRSLSAAAADTATNATQLDGVEASKFVQTGDSRLSDPRSPTVGSSNYIQNTKAQQSDTDFNISGDGTVGGTLSGKTVNAVTGVCWRGC